MPQPTIKYTIQDAKGSISYVQFSFQDGPTVAEYQGAGNQLLNAMLPLITGSPENQSLSVTMMVDPANQQSAAPTSDVEEGGLFIMRTQGGYSTSFRIPTFNESLITPGTDIIEDTGSVQTFLDLVTGGILVGATDVFVSDNRGDRVVDLASARESFQRSRNRR